MLQEDAARAAYQHVTRRRPINSGRHDDGLRVKFKHAEPLQNLEASNARKHEIEEKEVRLQPFGEFERMLTVVALADEIDFVVFREERSDAQNEQRMVVDDDETDLAFRRHKAK
jgi:hypothetical protein